MTVLSEKLINIDGYIFETLYGPWDYESDITIYASLDMDIIIGSDEYRLFPREGRVIFSETKYGDMIIKIQDKNKIRVGVRTSNSSTDKSIDLYGLGSMRSSISGIADYLGNISVTPEPTTTIVCSSSPWINCVQPSLSVATVSINSVTGNECYDVANGTYIYSSILDTAGLTGWWFTKTDRDVALIILYCKEDLNWYAQIYDRVGDGSLFGAAVNEATCSTFENDRFRNITDSGICCDQGTSGIVGGFTLYGVNNCALFQASVHFSGTSASVIEEEIAPPHDDDDFGLLVASPDPHSYFSFASVKVGDTNTHATSIVLTNAGHDDSTVNLTGAIFSGRNADLFELVPDFVNPTALIGPTGAARYSVNFLGSSTTGIYEATLTFTSDFSDDIIYFMTANVVMDRGIERDRSIVAIKFGSGDISSNPIDSYVAWPTNYNQFPDPANVNQTELIDGNGVPTGMILTLQACSDNESWGPTSPQKTWSEVVNIYDPSYLGGIAAPIGSLAYTSLHHNGAISVNIMWIPKFDPVVAIVRIAALVGWVGGSTHWIMVDNTIGWDGNDPVYNNINQWFTLAFPGPGSIYWLNDGLGDTYDYYANQAWNGPYMFEHGSNISISAIMIITERL